MKKIILYNLLVLSFSLAYSQKNEQSLQQPADDRVKIGYETYVDFHYTYDFNRPINNKRYTNSNPEYVNQFGLAYTYGQLYLEYGKMQVRAAAHAGDIVDIMYINETEIFKYIRELSLTYKLHDNVELQTGIFPAIYGAETFINKDNLHATRAVMTDFAPDYEAGFRLKYKMGKYWQGTAQFTNGWQVVRDNNHAPAFGFAHVYDKPGKLLFNYHSCPTKIV
ncbi:MAG: outer membrane beta-barrel protein [Cytophagales bacterium]